MNVRKMTTRSTGIVQKIRLTMNFSIGFPYPRGSFPNRRAGHAPCPPSILRAYSVTTTFVRSVWFSRLTLKLSFTDSFSRLTNV